MSAARPQVVVLGAGAIGSLFGLHLARVTGVSLLTRARHAQAVARSGLRISGLLEATVRIDATSDPAVLHGADLVLVTCKAFDTEAAIGEVRQRARPDTAVVLLQNGLGNEAVLERLLPGETPCARGVTSVGVTFSGPGHIHWAGHGPTRIGDLDNASTGVATGLASLLSASGLEEVSVSADIRADVWDKALGNIGINALGAITGLRNGELVGNTWTAAVMQALVHEAECVARQGGLHLEPAWPRVQDLARRTAGNRNSMLQDLEAGRPTEIEFMNGAVVRMAEAAGLSAPVNACVANLVRGLEAAGVHRGSGRGTDCRRESTRSAAP